MRLLALLAIALLAGTGTTRARAADTKSASAQILVMLHLSSPHFRPGNAYGGAYDDLSGRQARRRIAARLANQYGLSLLDDWPMPTLGVDCFVMQAAAQQNVEKLVARVSRDPRVEWAQALQMFHTLRDTDPLYTTQPSAALWQLQKLHDVSTGQGVRIGIIDSGVALRHPDLRDRIADSRNFVDTKIDVAEAHGTEIAGIIGARADNGAGIAGIAPQATLIALRACWQVSVKQTLCNSFTLAKALQFALGDNVQIINLSLSGPTDELLKRLLTLALKRGVTVVAARDANAPDGGFPASVPGVIAVSADAVAADNAGNALVLAAPGRDIPTTLPDNGWGFVSGASFATAHVTGLIALVKQLAPRTPMRQRKSWALFPQRSGAFAGMIDACATLQRSSPRLACAQASKQAMLAPW